jgi:acyl-CoA thioesterase-1
MYRIRPYLTIVWIGILIMPGLMSQNKKKVNPAFEQIQDRPGLPRVLILGDSISIGYTLALREELKSVANIHRPPENCRSTKYGLEKIDEWLGKGKWDLIHFNWGLHDLKYVDSQNRLKLPPEGKQLVPAKEYSVNLEILVKRLKKTGAKLIWRPTTPVPPGAAGRYPKDLPIYNAIALKIMKKYNVQVNDLNLLIATPEIFRTKPDNVHFTPESSARMAVDIAKTIKKALK